MKECQMYSTGFCKKAREAEEEGNIREQTIFIILAKVTLVNIQRNQLTLNEDDFAKIDLTEEHLNFLTEIAPDISDPALSGTSCKYYLEQTTQLFNG